jgi:type IV pilus assembly protein PilX
MDPATLFSPRKGRPCRGAAPRQQSGVILIIALIALVILMIGGVALVRSFDTSMLMSGNTAFKRDLVNQGERGMAQAITALSAGALASEATRQADVPGSNYSATSLASDLHGIPQVLLSDDATFGAAYTAGDIADAASKVTIRYVIDRQCSAAGAFSADTCTTTTATAADKGGSSFLKKAGGGLRPVYRISVRVTGPRNTQAYLQSTVTL